MTIAKSPSKFSLPQHNPGVTTVLEYLKFKFPHIKMNVWKKRMADGKVHWHDGSLISVNSLFAPQQRVYYYREVYSEPVIPLQKKLSFKTS